MGQTGVNVLIVEDDHSLRELLCETCCLNGFSVVSAATADEALALVDPQANQLIFVDFLMPGTNGLEFISQVKSKAPRSVVVGMSAWTYLEDSFLKAGAEAFLLKPLDFAKFEKTLLAFAGKSRPSLPR